MIRFALLVALAITVSAQEDFTSSPPPESTTQTQTDPPTTTPWPGQAYGQPCNGLLLKCNRHSETVACLQRRNATTTTPLPTTEDSVLSLFRGSTQKQEQVCETGLGVDLGRCQCRRNCKDGIYVDDGEFDEQQDKCVGLVGSTCSLLVPGCTKNAACVLVTGKCACNLGFVDDGNRRCVRRS